MPQRKHLVGFIIYPHNRFAVIRAVLISCATILSPGQSNAQIGDRILLDIEGSYHGQVHMEGFQLVLSTLTEIPTKYPPIWGAIKPLDEKKKYNAQWQIELDKYATSMLVLHETQKMGSYFPSDKEIKKALQLIEKRSSHDKPFRERLHFLRLSGRTLSAMLIQALQVKGFLATKGTDVSTEQQNRRRATKKGTPSSQKSESKQPKWLTVLTKKSVTRYFEGSHRYRWLIQVD